MSKTYCRFCDTHFEGLYLNCPQDGKWLAPYEGKDIDPDDEYVIVDQFDRRIVRRFTLFNDQVILICSSCPQFLKGNQWEISQCNNC